MNVTVACNYIFFLLWILLARLIQHTFKLRSSPADVADCTISGGAKGSVFVAISIIPRNNNGSWKEQRQQWRLTVAPGRDAPPQPIPKNPSAGAAARKRRETMWRWRFIRVFQRAAALHVGEILTDLAEQRQQGNIPTSDTAPQSRWFWESGWTRGPV